MSADTYILRNERVRDNCIRFIKSLPLDHGFRVQIRAERRNDAQNALMWAHLTDLSEQLPWDGERLTPTEYKDLLTACLRKQKVVRGVEGGLVFLGARTSQMSVSEMRDLLDLIDAFAAERGVVWSLEDSHALSA